MLRCSEHPNSFVTMVVIQCRDLMQVETTDATTDGHRLTVQACNCWQHTQFKNGSRFKFPVFGQGYVSIVPHCEVSTWSFCRSIDSTSLHHKMLRRKRAADGAAAAGPAAASSGRADKRAARANGQARTLEEAVFGASADAEILVSVLL
jgi:hypothetical protein